VSHLFTFGSFDLNSVLRRFLTRVCVSVCVSMSLLTVRGRGAGPCVALSLPLSLSPSIRLFPISPPASATERCLTPADRQTDRETERWRGNCPTARTTNLLLTWWSTGSTYSTGSTCSTKRRKVSTSRKRSRKPRR